MKDDGGSAFPHVAEAMYQGLDGLITKQITSGGMSLRDYFAAKAMAGFLGNGGLRVQTERCALRMGDEIVPYANLAESAYVIADAMLAERTK